MIFYLEANSLISFHCFANRITFVYFFDVYSKTISCLLCDSGNNTRFCHTVYKFNEFRVKITLIIFYLTYGFNNRQYLLYDSDSQISINERPSWRRH